MLIKHFAPIDSLKPYVKAIKIIESDGEFENRVLPNTSVALAFCFRGSNSYVGPGGAISLSSQTLSGLRKSPRIIRYSPNTSTLIVLFKETQAGFFFKEPLHELFEHSVSMSSIVPRDESQSIEDLLNCASNDAARVAHVEQFLLGRLRDTKADRLVLAAVERIRNTRGLISVKELASELCISTDAFEKRFRRVVGSSPKQYSFIVRMSSAVQRRTTDKLIDVAFDAGFYDQSHFNKSFKTFTGLQPSRFFSSSNSW